MTRLTHENLDAVLDQNPEWVLWTVTEEDARWIEDMASRRNRESNGRGWVSRTTDLSNEWHRSGLAGELAVSEYLDIPIKTVLGYSKEEVNEGDVGEIVEVKSSRSDTSNRWGLVVNDDHLNEDRIYVQTLTCLFPDFVIITGWAYGWEIDELGTHAKHSGTGHGIRILDQKFLRPLTTLNRAIERYL
jgi:hypothetical protein